MQGNKRTCLPERKRKVKEKISGREQILINRSADYAMQFAILSVRDGICTVTYNGIEHVLLVIIRQNTFRKNPENQILKNFKPGKATKRLFYQDA